MKLIALKALVAAVEDGSLRAASRRLKLSQPALTKVVRELELELGARLLMRSNKGVLPTAQGKVLFDQSIKALRGLDMAVDQIQQLGGRLILMASRALARVATTPDDYLYVYRQVLAQRYPRLALSGSVGAGWVRTGGVTTDLSVWTIGPLALSVPLLDGGRRAAQVDAAQARYDEAAALYRARVRQAVSEVEQALVRLQSTAERNTSARIAAEGYRASFEATEARYQGGLASLVELEDARRTSLAAENALIALQHERQVAWVSLYRAAGGGWKE